jgi:hypothetical protein
MMMTSFSIMSFILLFSLLSLLLCSPVWSLYCIDSPDSYFFHRIGYLPYATIDHFEIDKSTLSGHVYLNIILINLQILTIQYFTTQLMITELTNFEQAKLLHSEYLLYQQSLIDPSNV